MKTIKQRAKAIKRQKDSPRKIAVSLLDDFGWNKKDNKPLEDVLARLAAILLDKYDKLQ